LNGTRIVVGVGGGIAAFKAVELVRELGRRGAEVRVAMTASAMRFVGPMTFAGITGRSAATDLWDPSYPGEVHVELARGADAVVVAPATMNLLARAASGLADDVVLATVACARGPVIYAPAMHSRMWQQPATQRAVQQLKQDGAWLAGPTEGALASGEQGAGRMAEPGDIADRVEAAWASGSDLAGRRLVITAGPTVEDLDPVRFLGNRSSGRMGFALASRAAARGAHVTLVTGPVSLDDPPGVQTVHVRSALEMQREVDARFGQSDAIVMAAAVADYRPATWSEQKIEKTDGPMTLELVRNPDILADLGERRQGRTPALIGFAVESDHLVERARNKLDRKRVDLIVANGATVGFGGEHNEAVLVDGAGQQPLGAMSKLELADRILDRLGPLLGQEG
jgi:phosphopantothenoylcysteine decarboxylase/phosphopantothenate--cysteine ligase